MKSGQMKDNTEELKLLSQNEALQMLSDSIRFVNRKINGRMRHNKKDFSKLQWLKMQERLTTLYLSGLKNMQDNQEGGGGYDDLAEFRNVE